MHQDLAPFETHDLLDAHLKLRLDRLEERVGARLLVHIFDLVFDEMGVRQVERGGQRLRGLATGAKDGLHLGLLQGAGEPRIRGKLGPTLVGKEQVQAVFAAFAQDFRQCRRRPLVGREFLKLIHKEKKLAPPGFGQVLA